MLGEVALYSFVVLLISGIYLGLFFDPSMTEVVYDGPFDNLRGVHMSRAYESALDISFEVRGGLFVRQMHHWAALLFVAAMFAHMFRMFFTGAFRKPRETNWVIGVLLIFIATFEGFSGYSLPDDLLSGIGLRIASGITLSVPVIGTWAHWAIVRRRVPGHRDHPAALHRPRADPARRPARADRPARRARVVPEAHAVPRPRPHREERRRRADPAGLRGQGRRASSPSAPGSWRMMGGIFQINPIWNLGPYNPAQISSGSQPDFYMWFSEGMARMFPAWEIVIGNYRIPAAFWPTAVFLPLPFIVAGIYPAIERKMTGDNALHNLLQRPRDVPVRTSLGVMAIAFYVWLCLSAINDWIAFYFDISLNATTWAGRIGLLIVPPIAYWVAYRWCLGLQRSDRAVLEHGIETGIVQRLPHGEFIEIHQPLGGVDHHGHAIPLEYQGASVPKRMNQLGFGGRPGAQARCSSRTRRPRRRRWSRPAGRSPRPSRGRTASSRPVSTGRARAPRWPGGRATWRSRDEERPDEGPAGFRRGPRRSVIRGAPGHILPGGLLR